MIKFIKYSLIIFFFFFTSNTYSQVIAYANFDKIIKTSTSGKQIIEHYNQKKNKLISDIKTKEKNIQEKEKSLISQKNVLEPDEYKKKLNILREEIRIFNNESNANLNELQKKKDTTTNLFIKELQNILNEFAEKKNIDIILSSNQILIGRSSLDVTNDILKIVNDKIKNFKIN